MTRTVLTVLIVLFLVSAASAQEVAMSAKAELATAQGEKVGTVVLTQATGGVFIRAEFHTLPPGVHALHIHSVGRCEQPFASAGGHFNPDSKGHGFLNPEGYHAGDLPNFTVHADGKATIELMATRVTLAAGPNNLLDEDGSALIIHAGPDDYRSDPAGNSGPRLACGVITK